MKPRFTPLSRLLHWAMAAMILTMLFIGVTMVASLADYHALVSIHRPLGIAILVLVVLRYVNRRLNPPPPFLETMSPLERRVASASELFLYALMFTLPGRMGDAIGRALPHRDVRIYPVTADPSAKSIGVRCATQSPHGPRVSFVRNVRGSSQCRLVPHGGPA